MFVSKLLALAWDGDLFLRRGVEGDGASAGLISPPWRQTDTEEESDDLPESYSMYKVI